MKYMLLIYRDEKAVNDAEREHCYVESTQLAHELQSNGQFVSTSPLQPISMATTVRVRDGKRLVTDGPFAEAREQLGYAKPGEYVYVPPTPPKPAPPANHSAKR